VRRLVILICLLALALAGCSSPKRPQPAPTASPDLTRPPVAIAVHPGPFQAGPFPPPKTGAYVGAWIKPAELTPLGRLQAVDGLERGLGRKLPIVTTYRRFDQLVGTASDQDFVAQGATLMVSWATGDNRAIVAGEHDRLIRRQARAIKRLHAPVLLRMRWEMDRPNLRSEMHSASDYIAAWKHVRAIFAREGADNVSWVFCPTAEGFQRGAAAAFYPGDDQVDWTCVDVYAGAEFKPIARLMDRFLRWAGRRPKPIIIGEFGVAKAWGSAARAAWLTDAERTFKANPQIKAVTYFESDPEGNGPRQQFQLTGDRAAFDAFAAMTKDEYFNPR